DGLPFEDGCLLRIALITEVSEHDRDEIPEKKWIRFHHLATRFLKDNRQSDRVLDLWSGLIAAQRRHGYLYSRLQEDVFSTLDDEKRWPEYFECLHLLREHKQFSEDCTDVIAWLVNQSLSVAQVCERFSQIAQFPWLHDCVGTQILSALKLETDGFPFAESLKLIGPESRMNSERLPDVVMLHQRFLQAGWPDVLPSVLRSKRLAEVTQLSVLLAISAAFPDGPSAVPRPENPALPEWAAGLPAELHASIACLCALSGADSGKAQSIVARHFPAKHDLQNEIEALERRTVQSPGDSHRSARLQNLKRRLANPDPVSPHAIHRLRRKLDEAIVRHVFRDFRNRVLSSIQRVLHARIGGQRVCRELSVPRHLELVSSLLRLWEPWREFGLRLLRKCWGDDDWDHAREPANVRFLQSLEARGIRVAPWLQQRRVRISAEGRRHPLVLSFASNEVETMLMGYYFGTCLSPDGVNFFSAVANAIDVNKRVVYLRTVSGEVAGRCLLVLGDSGTLMTYHPYCNDEKFPFSAHMAEFAANLAAEMGTVVSHNDTVAKLVAPEWYDDGAHDLGNSVFSETSPLRVAIRAASEDSILSATEQASGVVGLSDTLLELLVELPEFASRPALIRPFIPYFERRETQLGVSSVIRAALLAFEAGEREFAGRVLLKYGPGWIVRQQVRRSFSSTAVQVLQALISIYPSKALRILRETRHRTVRSDA
ncbi:MAG: hypothetical protein H7Z17_13275, partial [Fuerstia sp.]|nr:hypothetical protein [Fuerstiella sp.]